VFNNTEMFGWIEKDTENQQVRWNQQGNDR
jgi:hypothetical protein